MPPSQRSPFDLPIPFLLASLVAAALCGFVMLWSAGQYARGALYAEAAVLPPAFVAIVSWLPFTLLREQPRSIKLRGVVVYAVVLLLTTAVAKLLGPR